MSETNPQAEVDSQKRRSTRVAQPVPLTVSGIDALGRPFQEHTSTLLVSCHGCRYQSKHYVLKNMWVTLEVPHNEAKQPARTVRARVMWVQRPRSVRELFHIGVELETSGNVWGIAFPPQDWFPFPETVSSNVTPRPESAETSSRNEHNESDHELDHDRNSDTASDADVLEAAEDNEDNNVHVLPSPGTSESSQQLTRQMAKLVGEAKQQVQAAVRDTATSAVVAETKPLLAALQAQLKDAAEKSVEAAVSSHMQRMQRETLESMASERDAGVNAIRSELARELDRRIGDARTRIDSQIAQVQHTREADFDEQIHKQLRAAIEKMQSLSGSLSGHADGMRAAIDDLRKRSEEAAKEERRRWHEVIDERASDAQNRLAQLEKTANALNDKISAVTATAESNWRELQEADIAAASARWKERIDASLQGAENQLAERITARGAESYGKLEERLEGSVGAIRDTFAQIKADADATLGKLKASIESENSAGQQAISQLQQTLGQVDTKRSEFSRLIQSASDELTRRGQSLVEAQSDEMSRRAESAISGMAERLQPVLEGAGQKTIERLAEELERQLTPQVNRASELVEKLGEGQERAETALAEHQERVWKASELSVQESIERAKDMLAEIEKEFGNSTRNMTSKAAADLEAKAGETTHTTFEALFKSAEWYEKKIQTQMQSTLEKGLEHASTSLREKAGELSGLFAGELDHYSRSYVAHSQNQMEENTREAAEKANLQMTQAGEAAAEAFGNRVQGISAHHVELFNKDADAAYGQNNARVKADVEQVRAQFAGEIAQMGTEFRREMVNASQQGVSDGRQQLHSEVESAKESLRQHAQSIETHLRESLESLGTQTLDEYKKKLEKASDSWVVITVLKLNQKSDGLIEQLAASTEKRLRSTCTNVFSELGETLRQRLGGLISPPAPVQASTHAAPNAPIPVDPPDENR